MHANPFLSSDNRATELLALVHSDVYDAAGHMSHGVIDIGHCSLMTILIKSLLWHTIEEKK
jgi:hypothetical protein